jgi:ubiquinone/menaquinone biosynthesis C-methylase UbiE
VTGTPGSISFDCIAERYDATRGGEERGEQFGDDLGALLDPSRRVLEIGVGTGVISLALRKRGFDVVGVDISIEMLKRARARLGPRVAQADAMALPIADTCVDQAIAVWVLHCVGDVTVTLREIARVLRPGGRCYVVDGKMTFDTDNPADVAYRELEAALGIEPRMGRVHMYSDRASDAGLDVERIGDSGPHPHETSLAHVVHNFESRCHSYMWDVPDDVWERASAPIIARLRARPDVDETYVAQGWQEILVLRRPTSQ